MSVQRALRAGEVALVGLLALSVRAGWMCLAQSPNRAVFSDMRGYIGRALDLLAGTSDVDEAHRLAAALYPYGTHYLYALLIWVGGRDAQALQAHASTHFAGVTFWGPTIGLLLLNTGTVVLATLCAARCLPGRWRPLAVGITCALWHPLVVFSGFFSSETPFAFLVALSAWALVRFAQDGRGAWLAGVATALAFVVRPQALLVGLVAPAWLLLRRRQLPAAARLFALPGLLLPLALVVLVSALRFHDLTDRWALISDNAPIARFFACTDYKTLRGAGDREFTPPARTRATGFDGTFEVDGYIALAAPLDAERRRVQGSLDLGERLVRVARNVRLLAWNNPLWPERNAVLYDADFAWFAEKAAGGRPDAAFRAEAEAAGEARARWRTDLNDGWAWVTLVGLLPLSLAGLLRLVWRFEPGLEVLGLHVATMVVSAALYFGEARYRVPYDPLLIVLAVSATASWRAAPSQDRIGRWWRRPWSWPWCCCRLERRRPRRKQPPSMDDGILLSVFSISATFRGRRGPAPWPGAGAPLTTRSPSG